jgi:hypothetical protein
MYGRKIDYTVNRILEIDWIDLTLRNIHIRGINFCEKRAPELNAWGGADISRPDDILRNDIIPILNHSRLPRHLIVAIIFRGV